MENFKYQLVSIATMNTQINVRMPEKTLNKAKIYAESHGFSNVQEFIRETVREKLYEELSEKETKLVKKIHEVSKKKGLYKSEKELFKKLRKK